MTEEHKRYLNEQVKSGLQIGDTVIVIRKARAGENGWNNTWVEEMDLAIGKAGLVTSFCFAHGMKVEIEGMDTFTYPYFVLEKVSQGRD